MIDINKKYRTRSGRAAVVHSINGPRKGYPVVASIESPGSDGGWIAYDFTANGVNLAGSTSERDLIEIREPREWWVNVYPTGPEQYLYPSKEAANGGSGSKRTECIRVREVIEP